MAEPRRLIYWDSNVILAYMSREPGRVDLLDSILDDVAKSGGQRVIVSSVLSKCEVAFTSLEKATRILDPEAEKKIDDFFADESVIQLAEVHEGVIGLSRDLMRKDVARNVRILDPGDAIHLATAISIGAVEFHTYNCHHFERHQQDVSFKICEPYILQPRLIEVPPGPPLVA